MKKKGSDKAPVSEPVENYIESSINYDKEEDREYWRENFMKHRSDLFFYALKQTKGQDGRAEMVLQQVCLYIETRPPGRKKVKNAKAYLMKMVRNSFLDTIPKHQVNSLDDPDSADAIKYLAVDPRVQSILEDRELLDLLGQGLGSLDQRIYELLRLGYSPREIATTLGITVEAVRAAQKRILYHAQRQLRQINQHPTVTPDKHHPDRTDLDVHVTGHPRR